MTRKVTFSQEVWDDAKTEESSLTLRKSRFWPIWKIIVKITVRKIILNQSDAMGGINWV